MSVATERSVGIIGAGAAGLITAHTLVQDGFANVQILEKAKVPGGVFSAERVYPGLSINNVHGEYRFTPLAPELEKAGGHPSGDDMKLYMETFAEKFLKERIRYSTQVLKIRRLKTEPDTDQGRGWEVLIQNLLTGTQQELFFDVVILCTGGCSEPAIPPKLSVESAEAAGFKGLVLHSSQLATRFDEALNSAKPLSDSTPGTVLVVGGGKSAQDISASFVNFSRKVQVVFETADPFIASSSPLPDFIRKSRLMSVFSSHSTLRTRLERFLHTTWIGSKIVQAYWSLLSISSFNALKVPKDSPLRRTHSLFWGVRSNDEGTGRPNGFHALVNSGDIELVAPARVASYGTDGRSVILHDGRVLEADVVILCTGFTSSWAPIFDEATISEIGLDRHTLPQVTKYDAQWNYASFTNPPESPPPPLEHDEVSYIYRGIVPAKNIARRDFAITGAIFTTNPGYTFEVSAHWIASYLRGDAFLRLPASAEEAVEESVKHAVWLRKRYPQMLGWTNESASSDIAFWSWPQATDDLLDDMGLPYMRSGGNLFNWPLKVISVKEIETLHQERAAKRQSFSSL